MTVPPTADLGVVLAQLSAVIAARRDADPSTSYVARLLGEGVPRIAKKVGEEAVETAIAAASADRAGLTRESADLLFHLLLLWAAAGVSPTEVAAELARREGVSGLAEKAARADHRGGRAMSYDRNNVFARILRGELPCTKVYEDAFALAFHDISPQAPTHVMVIPKGEFTSLEDFSATASSEMIAGFVRAIGAVARMLGVVESGFRILANHGRDANQEVPHFHVHVFGGRALGPMLSRDG